MPLMRALRQTLLIAGKEWRLLSRNPHGLAALFLMPAIFLLVMSFALKNTLTSADIALPPTGWLVEAPSPLAMRWATDWIERHGGQRSDSRGELHDALRARRVEAGVIVLDGWASSDSVLRPDRIELWLSNRIHPGAAGRLRTDIGFSMLQLQIKSRIAAAGPFASTLLNSKDSALVPPQGSLSIRYLYEIESGRKMTAVQQSVPAWQIFGMFFVVIP